MLKVNPLKLNLSESRWLRPFFVPDRNNRTLGGKSKRIFAVLLIISVLAFFSQSAQVSKFYNLHSLEEVEREFVLNFYQTYNQFYYWIFYQDNLAKQLSESLKTDSSGNAFWQAVSEQIERDNQQIISVSYGVVGSTNAWGYRRDSANQWQESDSKENQNFSAWFLRQNLVENKLYYREDGLGDRLTLFWLYQTEDKQQYYFQASVAFDLTTLASKLKKNHLSGLAAISAGDRSQFFFLDRLGDDEYTASAQGESSRAAQNAVMPEDSFELRLFLQRQNSQQLATLETNNQPLSYHRFDGVGYWVMVVPLLTNTDFSSLYIIMQERAFLGIIQLRTWMIISTVLLSAFFSLSLFAWYYYQHSRRYYFTNQIKEIIKQGEGVHLEFKSSLRYSLQEKKLNKELEKVVLKSIAAFNNSDGGLLLLGVDDAGKVLGLKADYKTLKKQDKDGFELHLRSLISRAYGDHFVLRQIEIYFPCLGKEEVCVLKIKKGRKPLYTSVVEKNGSGKSEKFYIRRGNSSIAMEKPSDIMAYQKDRFSWRGKLPFIK